MPVDRDKVARTTAVLAFHKVGDPPDDGWETWNYIDSETFEAYLQLLHDECYHVLDLHTFLGGLQSPSILPERSALLTFDDGYQSMLSIAQPILSRLGVPSVCFVPTNYVGGHNTWDFGNEPKEPICDWDELRELHRCGVVIQSHSVSHRSFSEFDAGSLDYELKESKDRLEEELGTTVDALAFPYGDNGINPDVTDAALAAAGYRAAFLYKGGVFDLPTRTPFRITRVPMGPDTNLLDLLGGVR
ncbi:MAG: polysaccharide deacetylase family protein [Planctomycetota bacterium]|nr:polysaccharide deacetylase family protein [Planctomycetota bacterium]